MNKLSRIFTAMLLALFIIPTVFAGVGSVSLVPDPVFSSGKNALLVQVGTLYSDSVQFGRDDYSSSQLTSGAGSGVKVENSFSLSWKTDEQYATYPTVFLKQIYNLKIVDSGFIWNPLSQYSKSEADIWARNNCLDLDKDGVYEWYGKINIYNRYPQIYCVGNAGIAGDVMRIDSANAFWKTSFTLSNGQETLSTTLTSTGSNVAYLGSNKAYIRYDGLGLFNYQKTPNNIYLFNGQDGSKVIFDSYRLNDIQTLYRDDALQLIDRYIYTGSGDILESKSSIESDANRIVNGIKSWTVSSDFPRDRTSFSGSQIKLNPVGTISFQRFIVYLNGDWIKITIPVGQPEIVSFTKSFNQLEATKTGTFTAQVKNSGNAVATFQATVDCGKANELTSTQIISSISPAETKSIQFQINSAQLDAKTTDSCTLTVSDTTKPSNQDSETISFEIIPRPTCSEGEQLALNEGGIWRVYECESSTGKFSKNIFTCGAGQAPQQNLLGRYTGCADNKNPDATIVCAAGQQLKERWFAKDTCEPIGGDKNSLDFGSTRDQLAVGIGIGLLLLFGGLAVFGKKLGFKG